MKKIFLIISIIIIMMACNQNSTFTEKGKFYSGNIDDLRVNLTFINDTIAAINSDNYESCSWNFLVFKKNNDELIIIDDLKLDTVRIRQAKNDKIILDDSEKEFLFEKSNIKTNKIDSLLRQIEIVKNFRDKGISYDCDYSFKEIAYFYETAIKKTKENLKNPHSAKFIKVDISKYNNRIDSKEYGIKGYDTRVSLDITATNSFGGFLEETYYVFFILKDDNTGLYEMKFSDSSYIFEDSLQKAKKELEELELD